MRPYRGFEAINIFSPIFQSNYHSVQAQFQKRFSDNSLIVLNYTWSHALTDSQNSFGAAQNSYDLRAEYSEAQFDRRHIFSGSYVYHLPFRQAQRGTLAQLLSGWELSGIIYAQSGLPLTAIGSDIDPAGLGYLSFSSRAVPRPDQLKNPNRQALHTVNQWFDTSAFASPPAQGIRPGNARPGSIVGPGAFRWDASVFKNTKLGEHLNLQFRAEATNVLNHINLDSVITYQPDPNFGRVISARDPRILQLGLKLVF